MGERPLLQKLHPYTSQAARAVIDLRKEIKTSSESCLVSVADAAQAAT